MTTYRTRLEAEIGEDGMLHLPVPEALRGSLARVVFEFQGEDVPIEEVDGKPVRVFGLSKDSIHPFDRLLAAQAIAEGLEMLGADAKLDAYGVRRTG